MMEAKYELEFELGPPAPFNIGKEMRITFSDGSQIKLYPKEKPKDSNKGAIIFELDRPDRELAEKTGKDKVNEFFNSMLITKENFEQLAATTFSVLKCARGSESFSFIIKPLLTAPVGENEMESAKKLIETIYTFPIPRRDIIVRSLRWFRRGAEANSEDRFIYRWISFDLLLALLVLEKKEKHKAKGTPKLIREFMMSKYMKAETAKLISHKHKLTIEKLSRANLKGFRGAERSKALLEELQRQKPNLKDILTKTMLCIYEVRNTLFHKGEVLETINQSSALLRDFFRESLKTYVESS